VNLIEGIVLDMESRWTPSGPNEVGIDGYIELFDKALGLTLAAQSKVATGVGADQKPTFDFWCAPADLEYWLAGNMPVILVVSDPASKEAWWVPVKEYFRDWTPGSPTAPRDSPRETLANLSRNGPFMRLLELTSCGHRPVRRASS
jgi:hypothetical protein